ncbi:MAG: MoxR family ATPase [Planctomycetaceae bacterium]|nr:MoxR family ATPase [Planctomycetaceae bacterium]
MTPTPEDESPGSSSPPRERLRLLVGNLERVIRGKPATLELLVTAFLAGGSVLMEDVPGVGKTTLARALAASVALEFQRIQFTPDLLPGDILGSSIYNPADGSFRFRKGPIFCSVLLADEINRASPRTQSALLEAMSESHATIDGVRHVLPAPFLVLATQNPVDFHGTYPLPEAQLDRFLMRLHPGYPDVATEVEILQAQAETHPLDDLTAVLSREDVLALQQQVRQVHVDPAVSKYLVQIVQHTREDSRLRLGVSPRGSLMLFRAAQAGAFLAGRDFVLPDDVRKLALHVLPHRIIMTPRSRYSSVTREEIVQDAIARTDVPV